MRQSATRTSRLDACSPPTLPPSTPEDPLSGLVVGQRPRPEPREGWSVLPVVAAGLNHHDLWSLRGVGLPRTAADDPRLRRGGPAPGRGGGGPAAGHRRHTGVERRPHPRPPAFAPLRASPGHAGRAGRGARGPLGAQAGPPQRGGGRRALDQLAHGLPDALPQAAVSPGDTVLVQGAGGGVATAIVQLGAAAGLTVWATGRSEEAGACSGARRPGGHFEPGDRLPWRVDAVFDSVGAATWSHSVNSLRPGGTWSSAARRRGTPPRRPS